MTDRRRRRRGRAVAGRADRRRFRLRPLLVLALARRRRHGRRRAHHGRRDRRRRRTAPRPQYVVNDFGTNNTVAGLLAAGDDGRRRARLVLRATAGAPVSPAAPAPPLAGWAALLIGLAEWPIATAEAGAPPADDHARRRLLGARWPPARSACWCSSARCAGPGATAAVGLDPWIAALGAVSFLIAAGGPLIPEGTADWSGNYNSDTLGVDLPTLFFVGRRRAARAARAVRRRRLPARAPLRARAWRSAAPSPPAGCSSRRPPTRPPARSVRATRTRGSLDLQPHAVTIVGFALVGFFALVAVVMALLDADR